MIEDIKKTLWATADKLRANMDAAEYTHMVLELMFLKYLSEPFQTRCKELETRFAEPYSPLRLPDVQTLVEEAAA